MRRAYVAVCLSTHSPQVLELVWTMETLRKTEGSADALLDLFGAKHSKPLRDMAQAAMAKVSKVYYFDPTGPVQDITHLDPASETAQEASWGGLLEFSARANEAVAKATATMPSEP